jgi:hypothetical protein
MTKLAAVLGWCCLFGACAKPATAPAVAPAADPALATPTPTPTQQLLRDLEAMGNAGREVFLKTQAFPTDQTAILPATGCCAQNFAGKGQCAPAPELFRVPPWTTLGFHPDGAQPFQYNYIGVASGRSFTAVAVGDLDCDGVTITWVLTGDVINEQPVIRLVEPPPGQD